MIIKECHMTRLSSFSDVSQRMLPSNLERIVVHDRPSSLAGISPILKSTMWDVGMESNLRTLSQPNLVERLYSQVSPLCAHLHPYWLRVPRDEYLKLHHTVFLVPDCIGKCSLARRASRLIICVVYHSDWTHHFLSSSG